MTATGPAPSWVRTISSPAKGSLNARAALLFLVALPDERATTWQITGNTAAVGVLAASPAVIETRSFWIGWSTRRVDESLAWVSAADVPDQARRR